jgi:hypothetical protein
MLTAEVRELLRSLFAGTLETAAGSAFLEQFPANELITKIRDRYRIVFQERRIGTKHEIGLARSVLMEITAGGSTERRFHPLYLTPVLHGCLFLNSYGNSISGISATSRIHIYPALQTDEDLILKTSTSYKLEKTVDGWVTRTLRPKQVKLSEQFLAKRGWKFDVLTPSWPKP